MKQKKEIKIADSRKVAEKLYMRIEKEISDKRRKHQHAKRLAAALAAMVTATGCTQFGASRMFENSDAGFVMLAGDAEGIRAYNDGVIGLITDTKASPDVKSSYWQNRDNETQVRTLRVSPQRSYSQQKQQNRNVVY